MNTTKRPFPAWIRRAWPSAGQFGEVKRLVGAGGLHTVCQSAHCPNQSECWGRGTATFMVLGNECTRHCAYCAVNTAKPEAPGAAEPEKVAAAVTEMGLRHVVITSVTRDDLPDGGADHIGRTIEAIKSASPETTVEVLVQDFCGDEAALERVMGAGAEVFSHNLETVARLFPVLRDRRFTYPASLDFLRRAHLTNGDAFIKSSLMVGCGETDDEIRAALTDLRRAHCDAVSIGQYLQPTAKHHPVARYVEPETFQRYETWARELGFIFVAAGPFVRSSYRAEELLWHDPERKAPPCATK